MKDEYDFSKMKRRCPVRVDVKLEVEDVKESVKEYLKFFSIKSAQIPTNHYVVRKGFFIVKNECFVVFKSSLQTNIDEALVKNLKESLYPGCEVRELTLYLPQDFISTLND